MSCSMITSERLIELSDRQQELLTGGNQPQISNNNFAQRNENTTETNRTTPLGKVSKTNTDFADINSGAQTILSSDAPRVAPLGSVNNLLPPLPNNPISVNSPLGMF
ncbi:hypothetical protein H6G06_11785 [Anabaena sphaerica FACHB-251]|uniref:Uncharacterized protein n=1 Tax=Anabaena sphaerica FACHB-251 TaxID=2692883 RepID=A0A926WHB4_9NOST|nr:CTB family bacteriocin [Anabaena sphaerica]MBD2294152.1 hypothetical protein [Anabaena sphaerica FACHB-251]